MILLDPKNKFIIVSGLLIVASIINGYFFDYINKIYNHDPQQQDLINLPLFTKFFIIIFFAPALETIIFQYIPIEFCLKIYRNTWLPILLSSTLFSIVHYYNIIYSIMAFVGGTILASYYIFVRAQNKVAILYTMAFHAIYNLYGLIFVN